jgi:hypothetical protein
MATLRRDMPYRALEAAVSQRRAAPAHSEPFTAGDFSGLASPARDEENRAKRQDRVARHEETQRAIAVEEIEDASVAPRALVAPRRLP